MSRRTYSLIAVLLWTLAGCTDATRPVSLDARASTTQSVLLYEPTLSGSAYLLTDVTSSTITVVNNQETVTAPWDNQTRFRSAQLNQFPTDPSHPCYSQVTAYNDFSSISSDSFLTLLSGLVACGSRVRAIVQFDNGLPPNPVRLLSFQPIP